MGTEVGVWIQDLKSNGHRFDRRLEFSCCHRWRIPLIVSTFIMFRRGLNAF